MTCVTKAMLHAIAHNPKNDVVVAVAADTALKVFSDAEHHLTPESADRLASLCQDLDANDHGALLDYLKTSYPDCCPVCLEVSLKLRKRKDESQGV